MNTSPSYHSRRQTGYPETQSRDYSSRPPPHYRAASVDPFRASTTYSPVYRSHDLGISASGASSLPPPLPHHQSASYRTALTTRPASLTTTTTAASTSANRYRSTERSALTAYGTSLPRSNSLSKFTLPPSHASTFNDARPSSHYYPHYSRPYYSNNHYYALGPLLRREASPIKYSGYEMTDNFSHLSVRSSNYQSGSDADFRSQPCASNHNNRRVDRHCEGWAEPLSRRQQNYELEVEEEHEEDTPKPATKTRESPDSRLSSGAAASESDRSSSPADANLNNTTSPTSSASATSYDRHSSSGLHGGRAVLSTASSTSSSNALGTNTSSVAPTSTGGLVGLSNLGNTCFMNCVIQCLSNTRELLRVCMDYVYQSELNVNSSMKGNLFTAYADLMRQMWVPSNSTTSAITYVSPQRFRSQIQKFAPRFMGYAQQDAHEFLRYLVQGLHEDVNRVTKRPPSEIPDYDKEDRMPDSSKAALYWQRYKRIDNSIIADLFLGQLMSTLECMSCGHKSTTFDPFWDLSLPIPRGADVNILNCFDLFTSNEILDGAELPVHRQTSALPVCSGCKRRQPCRKSFSIQRFPTILVIHFKRFSGERSRSKLTTFIDYPVEHLDLNRYAAHCSPETNASYRLYAVSNHSGSVFGGHYTAYCLHPKLGSWFEFNDTRVRPIRKMESVSSEAYVLFYQRIDGGSA